MNISIEKCTKKNWLSKSVAFIAFFLATQTAHAQDFVSAQKKSAALTCSNTAAAIKINQLKTIYRPYDKNLKIKKITGCGLTKINNMNLVNFSFDAEIHEGPTVYRALILEFASFDEKKNKFTTVRSEIVDQIPESGDPADTQYEQTAEFEFGFDKNNKNLKLKIQPLAKYQKIEPYYLKFNRKKNWFENDFSNLKK